MLSWAEHCNSAVGTWCLPPQQPPLLSVNTHHGLNGETYCHAYTWHLPWVEQNWGERKCKLLSMHMAHCSSQPTVTQSTHLPILPFVVKTGGKKGSMFQLAKALLMCSLLALLMLNLWWWHWGGEAWWRKRVENPDINIGAFEPPFPNPFCSRGLMTQKGGKPWHQHRCIRTSFPKPLLQQHPNKPDHPR